MHDFHRPARATISLTDGIWVPLITPFTDGHVDHAGLSRLAATLAISGVAGFVVCGSTGEAFALDAAEQEAVLQTVAQAAASTPLLMGVGGPATADVLDALQRWSTHAIQGFLIAPPHYVRPSQAGIARHFLALADASPLPIVLYDIPARTGVRIETSTMLALAGHPRIAGVKDCSGDMDHLQAVLADGRLRVFCGDDHRMLSSLCLGAHGAIAASAHLRPELFVRLTSLVGQGRLDEARRLWRDLWPLTTALFSEPSPGPVKAALALLHGLSDELRSPMTKPDEATMGRVRAALAALGC